MFNSKTLITLTVLLVALTAGSALAGDMNWSFYGKLHSSINMIDDSAESQIDMSSNTSRFGFKGNQELNENFTFIWQIEGAVNMTQKDSAYGANRNSFLGLKGNWGTGLFGIHDTPFKTLGRKSTFFYDSVGDNRQIMMHTDDRTDDYLLYMSPNFDGFGFQAGYEFDQNAAGAVNPATSMALMAHYAKDEFFFGFAYESLSGGNFDYIDDMGTTVETDDVFVEGEAEVRMRFAGKYSAEKFAVALSYQMLTDLDGVKDWKSTTVGGEVLFHANDKFDIKGAYYMLDPDTESTATDLGSSLMAFGVDYNYVKNIQFYIQYAGMSNETNAMMGLGDYNGFGSPTGVAAAGETVTGISIGTNVKF